MRIKPIIAAFLPVIFVLTGCGTGESSKDEVQSEEEIIARALKIHDRVLTCLLYTSDAADD